jgi:hypothetical protein
VIRDKQWVIDRLSTKKVQRTIGIIILAGLMVFLIYQILKSWQEIKTYPWQLDFKYIIIGFFVYSVSLFSTGGIWASIMARTSNIRHYLLHVRLYCLTNLAQRLPTPLPYIGARAETYAQLGVPRTTTIASMSLEVVITIVGAVSTAIITLPFSVDKSKQTGAFWVWAAMIPLLVFIIKPKWLFAGIEFVLKRFKKEFPYPSITWKHMVAWSLASTAIWFLGGMLYFLLAKSVYPLPVNSLLEMINVFALSGVVGWVGQLFFFVPLVTVRQLTTAYLLSLFLPWPVAVAVALLTRLVVMVYELLWALFFSIIYRNPKNGFMENSLKDGQNEV